MSANKNTSEKEETENGFVYYLQNFTDMLAYFFLKQADLMFCSTQQILAGQKPLTTLKAKVRFYHKKFFF